MNTHSISVMMYILLTVCRGGNPVNRQGLWSMDVCYLQRGTALYLNKQSVSSCTLLFCNVPSIALSYPSIGLAYYDIMLKLFLEKRIKVIYIYIYIV